MPNNKSITVLSTLTEDRLVDESGQEINKSSAGPGFFITEALKKCGITYDFLHGPQLEVEILITKDGEQGRVPEPPAPQLANASQINEWTIVSTLLDEWELGNLSPVSHLFIDIQGFVRSGNDFGKKKNWDLPDDLRGQVFCLKGTDQELSFLPATTVSEQKDRLLVITKGDEGADVYYQGQLYRAGANKLNNLPDTIGAGDTFFANFVAELFLGSSIFSATDKATLATEEFLKKKYS